jgi:hypothetical protein
MPIKPIQSDHIQSPPYCDERVDESISKLQPRACHCRRTQRLRAWPDDLKFRRQARPRRQAETIEDLVTIFVPLRRDDLAEVLEAVTRLEVVAADAETVERSISV